MKYVQNIAIVAIIGFLWIIVIRADSIYKKEINLYKAIQNINENGNS